MRPPRRACRFGSLAWAEHAGRRGGPCPLFVVRSTLSNAGLGVFTSIDLPAGAAVTPYDGVVYRGPIDRATGARLLDYALDLDGTDGTCILGAPPRDAQERAALAGGEVLAEAPPEASRGLGHLLNDALHPEVTGRRNNCVFRFVHGSHRAYVVTERPVRAGAELLVPYHAAYWAARAGATHLPQRVRAFCEAMALARRAVRRTLPGMEVDEYVGAGRYLVSAASGGGTSHVVTLAMDPSDGSVHVSR